MCHKSNRLDKWPLFKIVRVFELLKMTDFNLSILKPEAKSQDMYVDRLCSILILNISSSRTLLRREFKP